MSQKKKYARGYLPEYLKMGFIESVVNKQHPTCLLCHRTLSNKAMKPSRLREHLSTNHPNDKDKPIEYFQEIYKKFQNRSTIIASFKKQHAVNEDRLIAAYRISRLIAKSGKSYNIGETVIIPSIKEFISTVMHQDIPEILKMLPLSNSTVKRRIEEMAVNVEKKLISILQNSSFSMQLDKSTIADNNALLMAYVRYFDENNTLREERLFAINLITDTRGLSIFNTVKSYFTKNNIPLNNIVACATDGAPLMIGRYCGFVAYLKEEVPNVLCIHCVVHRQHLVGKHLSTSLHSSLTIIIRAINKIKSNAKNDRMFRQLCQDNNEDFITLLLHTEVQWLSKGTSLARFVALYDSVIQFFESHNETNLCQQLKTVKNDAFYLADIFKRFNDVNLELQGANKTLIGCQSIVSLFIDELLRYNLLKREFHQFPELSSIKNDVTPEDIDRFSSHLNKLKLDMEKRFEDILKLKVYDWMKNPFTANIEEADTICQEELLEIRYDEESKHKFNSGGYENLWENKKNACLISKYVENDSQFIDTFPYLISCGIRL
ncbi:zinc finger BED domain-containing protein 5-like [Pantherophis guttatus]|uniref:Zinc finger BED domain-containing protein 5-like n=1 Tax=Pantherophis guttatus TaxID=94885 RepID=A0A6P9CVC7_PANGU|nr:zinc finger BED domain-containing protein 5-like [Pantherophis guttatus]